MRGYINQPKKILIVKASGEVMPFYPEKLKRSLLKSGASEEQAQHIIAEIQPQLYEGISTKKIYQQAFRLLKSASRPYAAKYKLKRAIMELGPSGFPFEKFIAYVFRQMAYKVETGVMIDGTCVKHEVDVTAEKDTDFLMIECKFHHEPGIVCDVKIPLYIQARFKDLESKWMKTPQLKDRHHEGWLVTNTRFSADAIQYGACAGLHLLGWDYPADKSLNRLIDESALYPLTCLTTLTRNEKQNLLNQGLVLTKDLLNDETLLKNAGIAGERLHTVMSEAVQLCP